MAVPPSSGGANAGAVPPSSGGAIAAAVRSRTAAVVDALRAAGDAGLAAPSALPGWSRLTVACHLRYGARALARLTAAAAEATPAAYYPRGRAAQRPGTLVPAPGEAPTDVVSSLAAVSDALDAAWAGLDEAGWAQPLVEPDGATDLGPNPLVELALLRLTEVEVHGSDLDLGPPLAAWSPLFVRLALPARLNRLNRRRANHRAFDTSARGSWLLVPTDGEVQPWLVAVHGEAVRATPADPSPPATATLAGPARDLLALLLGRPLTAPLRVDGDAAFAAAFSRALPGP